MARIEHALCLAEVNSGLCRLPTPGFYQADMS